MYSQLPGKTIDKNITGPHNVISIGSTLGRNFSSLNNNKPLAEQENLNLSSEIKEIIIGLCLGDLYRKSSTRNAMLEQGKYILHLYELKYCRSKPQYSDRKPDLRTNKRYIRFQTRSLPCFNEFQYTEGKKIIPINELLTARGLAYWAQDYKTGSGLRLSTKSFTKEENL